MKATGIVRKIDNLGRVVIPKEIRTEMQINNGNTLEIYVDKNDTVVLKKYSPVRELDDLEGYIETLEETTDSNVIITDTDKIIAASSELEEYQGHTLSKKIKKIMEKRKTKFWDEVEDEDLCLNFRTRDNKELGNSIITPIMKQGDILGGIVLTANDKKLTDFEAKSIEVTAKVISKRLGL
ncbi:MAG: stage V sporulation T C-terminal domain-containing protein [Bacillota bacterium]